MVTERGEARVTPEEEAILCAGILIGAFAATLVIGILAIVLRYAVQIDAW